MNKILPALLLIAAFAPLAPAQTAAELKIKKLSEFDAHAAARDPFWPIGWQKPALDPQSATAASAGVLTLKAENFVVTSIATGALPLAVINGRAYGEGELIQVEIGGSQKVGVQVCAIRDGVVVLRYQNQTVNASMKR